MNLSRRRLIGGLVALVAAPAIVRVESLMALPAKQQFFLPEGLHVHFLDDFTMQETAWLTLDDYYERILSPIVDRLQQQLADAVIYGSGVTEHYQGDIRNVGLQDLLVGAKPTPSFE